MLKKFMQRLSGRGIVLFGSGVAELLLYWLESAGTGPAVWTRRIWLQGGRQTAELRRLAASFRGSRG